MERLAEGILYSCRSSRMILFFHIYITYWRTILHYHVEFQFAMPEQIAESIPQLELRVPTGEEEEDVAADSFDETASQESSVISSEFEYDSDEGHEPNEGDKPSVEDALGHLTIDQPTSPSPSNGSDLSKISDFALEQPTQESVTKLGTEINELAKTIHTLRTSDEENLDADKLAWSEDKLKQLREQFLQDVRTLRDRMDGEQV